MNIDIKKKIIFPLILLILSTLIALFMAEITLRILGVGYGNSPQESDPVFHHVHPAEYHFTSHIPTGEYGGHNIYYDADRLVANPAPKAEKKRDPNCQIAFLGDSFTEAGQVAYDDSFAGIIDNHSNCTIKNYGVSSYSPIFYLLQWRKQVKALKPKLVVVQLYSNDISADSSYLKMATKDSGMTVTAIPGPSGSWISTQLRKSYFMRFLRKVQLQVLWMYDNQDKHKSVVAGMVEENPDITQLSANLIKTLAKEVEASGTQFLLTVVPSKHNIVNHIKNDQTPEFSDKWKVFSEKNNIAFMDLTGIFQKESARGIQLFFAKDIHFNEQGHQLIATELSRRYPLILFKQNK